MNCTYCGQSTDDDQSREHVLPDFLGCPLRLQRGVVCTACNQFFNRELHLPLRSYVLPILARLGVSTSKTGAFPSFVHTFLVAGEELLLRITKGDVYRHRPQVKQLANGDYEIIAGTKSEFDSIARRMRKKLGLVIKQPGRYENLPPAEARIDREIDPELLCRIMAQLSLNCILHWFGREIFNREEFRQLIELTMGRPSEAQVGFASKSGQELQNVSPRIIASFHPLNEGGLIRINLFDTLTSKVSVRWGTGMARRFFIIDSTLRSITTENEMVVPVGH